MKRVAPLLVSLIALQIYSTPCALAAKSAEPQDASPFKNFDADSQIEANEAEIAKLISAGKLDDATKVSQTNLLLVEKVFGGKHGQYAKALNNMAWLLQSKGDYAGARKLFEQAMSIEEARLRGNDPKLATVYNNLASLVMFQGDYETAKPLYEKALSIQKASLGENHPDVARTLSNLAVLMDNMGKPADALPLHQESLRILETRLGENDPDVATALNNVANAYQTQGNPTEALKLYERALRIREAALGADSADVAQSLTNAALLIAATDAPRAKSMLERALSIYTASLGEQHPDLIGTLNELGKLAWREGRRQEATDYFLRAADITNRHIFNVLPALSFAEQQAFLSDQVPEELSLLLSTCTDTASFPKAYGYIFKWKGVLIEGLSRQSALRKLKENPKLADAANQLAAVRQQLADWYFKAGSRSVAEWDKRNKELLAQKEAIERQLASSGDMDIKDVLAEHTLTDFAKTLRPDETMADIFRYRKLSRDAARANSYGAAVLLPNGDSRFVDLGSADEIDKSIQDWRKQVLVRNEGVEQWVKVTHLLWTPLRAAVPPEAKHLWINPDSEVSRIPWHLLASNGTPLLAQIDSSRELLKLRSEEARAVPPQMVLAGGVHFGGAPGHEPFPFLPGTVKEADSLKALAEKQNIAVELLTGDEPTKLRVLEEVPKAGWIHLATHGFFIDERTLAPTRAPLLASGLVFAKPESAAAMNQILTAEELVGANFDKARLVTLSACETGLGEKVTGQGVLGLRSAIMAAGARCVVMSLWKVPDDSTLLLMNRFYENLWGKKLPIAEALRQAQVSVRDEPYNRFREPIHWAGWICVGEAW